MKSASENLVVLNKKLDTMAELKKENGELKKKLAGADLVKLKKERDALKDKNIDLRDTISDWKAAWKEQKKELDETEKERHRLECAQAFLDSKIERLEKVEKKYKEEGEKRKHLKELKELQLQIEKEKNKKGKSAKEDKVKVAKEMERMKTAEIKERKRFAEECAEKREIAKENKEVRGGRLQLTI